MDEHNEPEDFEAGDVVEYHGADIPEGVRLSISLTRSEIAPLEELAFRTGRTIPETARSLLLSSLAATRPSVPRRIAE
jgi:hypothetical protein